jgi:hypothetical protein
MRSVLARLAFWGLVGISLAGCGTNGTALPTGGLPNNTGGGPVNVSNQNPPGGTIPGVLIDGGIVATAHYSGFNMAATDTQSTADAGTDPLTDGSGTPPTDPVGSHSLTFNGSGVSQIIFLFSGTVPALYYLSSVPGQIEPTNYDAIVLYATPVTAASTPPASGAPSVAIELTGGSNFSSFDVRSTCGPLAATGATPTGGLVRYVCALPAYGAAAGTTGSVTLVDETATVPAIKTSYNVDTNISNPRTANPTGSYVPVSGSKYYFELIYGSPTTTASIGNIVGLDYVYAEAGTH